MQSLLDNLGTDTVGRSWIGKRVGRERKSSLLPRLPLRGFLEEPRGEGQGWRLESCCSEGARRDETRGKGMGE